MGICCSGGQSNYNELEIEYVFNTIEESGLQFYTISEIEDSLKSQFGTRQTRSRDEYINFLSYIMNNEKIQDVGLLQNILTSVVRTERNIISVPSIYLALFFIIDNKRDMKGLYDIFVNAAEGRLNLDSFYQILYIVLRAYIVTLSDVITKALKGHIRVNMDVARHFEMFNENNFKKFIDTYTAGIIKKNPLEVLTYDEFVRYMADKMFIFSYKDIRHSFIELIHKK
jgi:hypothetical protein